MYFSKVVDTYDTHETKSQNMDTYDTHETKSKRHREKLDDEVMRFHDQPRGVGSTVKKSCGCWSTVKKRLRAARLALAALVACDKVKVALDPTADGAWGTLLHCVPGSVLAAPGSWQGNFR